MPNWSRDLVAVLFLLACAACASTQETAETAGEQTTVQVENQNFLDMTVYVFERGRRVRLGTVPGISTRTFEIPARMIFGISALRFEADPVGSNRSSISDEIAITQGESLRLVIPPS